MTAVLRVARPADVPAMHRLRLSVRENVLTSGVTEADYLPVIARDGRGWVIEDDGVLVAFAAVTATDGNVWALFVAPGHEGRGHGRRLHDAMLSWLSSRGAPRPWLTTMPGTRAQRFYERAGWRLVATLPGGERRYEHAPGTLVLDHLFICCAPGAPPADALARLGFREGPRSTHAGQGTANRRFFFADFYLELLWVDDPDAARSPRTQRTALWERWSRRGAQASPFGLLLRRSDAGAPLPFATWDYRPRYLPDGLAIAFAEGVPLAEPAIAVLPTLPRGGAQAGGPLEHADGFRELRSVVVHTPAAAELSAASRHLRDACGIAYRDGDHAVELAFTADRAVAHDLRPALPLVLRGIAAVRDDG